MQSVKRAGQVIRGNDGGMLAIEDGAQDSDANDENEVAEGEGCGEEGPQDDADEISSIKCAAPQAGWLQ